MDEATSFAFVATPGGSGQKRRGSMDSVTQDVGGGDGGGS